MFERRIWVIGNIALAVLLLLSLRIAYWQLARGDDLYLSLLDPMRAVPGAEGPDVLTSDELRSLPQPLIQRTVDMLTTITRGDILDRSGEVLVSEQVEGDGATRRVYRLASLAGVTGYTSGIRIGVTGLELTYNTTLLGLDRLDTQLQQIVHAPVRGSNLRLTIDADLQQRAADALAGRPGAVVVLDGHSGAILAMASAPTFDPNRVQEAGYVEALLNCGDASCRAPFLNRATQAQYSPGSTWKTISLIAALDSGQVTPETIFDFGEPLRDAQGKTYYVYSVAGGMIPDPNHEERQLDLTMSYAKSANAAFARIGDEMNAGVFIDYAGRFGFGAPGETGRRLLTEIPMLPGQLALNLEEIRANDLLRAATAIGQGELLTSPLQMGAVALSILNEGNMPLPYLVESIQEPGGITHRGPAKGRVVRDVMKPETAEQVKEIMVAAVERGYGGAAQVSGLKVGGKTGTAQLDGDQQPHAWFLGWAEKGKDAVVIVVLLENAGQGSVLSAPIFAQLAGPAIAVIAGE